MNDRYQRLFDLSIDLLCVADSNGFFVDVNHAWEKTLGFTVSEIKSKPFFEFIHPDDRQKTVQQYSDQQVGTSAIAFQNRYVCKDGSHRWLEWVATPVLENGLIYAMARDVTERKRMEMELENHRNHLEELVEEREKQLHRALRMETVGRLACGIAHDFNNILSVILASSELLLKELNPMDPLWENVKEIDHAAHHAESLTKQLLAFGRRQVLQPKFLNLNPWVESVEQILRRVIGENIQLVTKLRPDLHWIKADPAQLEQVVVNLAINARDAMPNGGRLIIETFNSHMDEEYSKRHEGAQTGPHATLTVSDSGIGMTKEIQAQIFEPFFTTKEEGKGTGLGLSTVFGIVKQSGGNIWVYSEEEKGTTFKFYFPAVEYRAGENEEPKNEIEVTDMEMGTGIVLLVEDEEAVRRVTKRILIRAGYEVFDVANANEALETFKRNEGKFDVVLTDVIMPIMAGPELAARLRKVQPYLKVIYMSGYTENAIVHNGALDSAIDFIAKPFSSAKLVQKIQSVIKRK